MITLEQELERDRVFGHITHLSKAEDYGARINYIIDFLIDEGFEETEGRIKIDKPYFFVQELPEKWQKREGMLARNVVAIVPGESDTEQLWVAHNDTTQGFEPFRIFTKEGWKTFSKNFFNFDKSLVYQLIKRKINNESQPKKDTTQYGANDNGSGCAILLENAKDSLTFNQDKKQVYLFSGAEEGSGSRLSGLLGPLALVATGSALLTGATDALFAVNFFEKSTEISDIVLKLINISRTVSYTLGGLGLLYLIKPFDSLRIGIIGSKHYADTNEVNNIESAIAVDMLGGGEYIVPKSCMGMEPLRFLFNRQSDSKLNAIIKDAIYETGGSFIEQTLGASDHVAFIERGIPSAGLFTDIKSLTDIHTTKDTAENINLETLASSCKVISLVKKRLNGVRKKDLKKLGDFAFLYEDKINGEQYVMLRHTNDVALSQIYRVEENGGKYVIKDFVDWTVDMDMKQFFTVNDLHLKKKKVDDFTVVHDGNEISYRKPFFSELVNGKVTKIHGYVQGDIAEHLIPSLFLMYCGFSSGFSLFGLIPSIGGSFFSGISATVVSALQYKKLTTEARENTVKGDSKQMYHII
ncbi:MAG: M28 family peptidase [archaeon]